MYFLRTYDIMNSLTKLDERNKMKNAKIELDVVDMYSVEEIAEFLKNGIIVTLITEDGPAGGNPLYLFDGNAQAIKEYLMSDDYAMDEDDIDDIYPQLSEA